MLLNCETWACFDKLDVLKCVSNWWQAHAELMVNCLGNLKRLKWSSFPYKTIVAWIFIFHNIPGQLWRRSCVLWHTGWKSLPQTSECASVCGRQCWSTASKVSLSASARTITVEFPQQNKRGTLNRKHHWWALWDFSITHKILGHELCNCVVVILSPLLIFVRHINVIKCHFNCKVNFLLRANIKSASAKSQGFRLYF